ncbi:PAS domain-containing sensor histidine kinase [Pseudalkalibacillus hwajinpoensis]|uniref:histidine kinase n=1 Tax=Guptibacillus hwajinpoensis TaxID=208199 RepID=A0A4U1MNI2_9BACL|nr:PAS domain S-box protein [Pseudalkalibacillus hwajinpoensis]TKD72030.1 PAS domain S-box protein [Pseudalkalibacillus hwajinpoensis]
MQIQTRSIPWIIIGNYFLFGSLWILLSDTLLYNLSHDFLSNRQIGIFKGWFFILLTCGFLYFLLKHLLSKNQEMEKQLIESEERYRRLVESSPYGISLMQKGKVNYTNQTGLDIIGIPTLEDLHKKQLSLVVNPEDTKRIRAILQQMEADPSSEPQTVEYQLVRSNDQIIDVESTFIPIIFKDEAATIIQTSDITERKRAVKELWEAKQLIQAIISASPIATLALDMEANIRLWNPAAEKIFGWRSDEIIGKKSQIVPEGEKDITIPEIIEHGHIVNKEVRRKRKDGSLVYTALSTAPIQDKDGKINGIMAAFMDITDKKQTEEALLKTEKLSAVGQLAASVAHEIRNPLTSVKGFIQLLEQDESVSDKAPFISIMLSEIDRMDSIIKDLLILAKPQAERLSSFRIDTLLSYVVQLLSTQASLYNVFFIKDFSNEDYQLFGEENQLKQVFINLIKNAIESMPLGGNVTLRLSKEEDVIIVKIEDEGVGIPQHKIKTLGEPFYTTKEEGTGLGLLSSFKIIENHNGSIKFDSTVGIGTTVTVQFPVTKEEQ